MQWAILIVGLLANLLILGIMGRLLAAIFSVKSRNLIKASPKRHWVWVFTAVIIWIFWSEFPDYISHKHRAESKRKFIEKMQHDLKSDPRFSNLAIETNHLHFISVTGMVSSAEEQLALRDLIQTNRTLYQAPVSWDVVVSTNLNK